MYTHLPWVRSYNLEPPKVLVVKFNDTSSAKANWQHSMQTFGPLASRVASLKFAAHIKFFHKGNK